MRFGFFFLDINIPFSDIINNSDDDAKCQVNSACRITYSGNVTVVHTISMQQQLTKRETKLDNFNSADSCRHRFTRYASISILSTQSNGFANTRNVSFGLGGCGSICDAHSGISSVHWSLDNNGIVPIISGVNSTSNTSQLLN